VVINSLTKSCMRNISRTAMVFVRGEKSKFKTWFIRICINHISSYKRDKAKRVQTQDFDNFNEEVDKIYHENDIENNIDREYVLSLLRQMPDNYQLVFNMFVIDGYSHEEISWDTFTLDSRFSRLF